MWQESKERCILLRSLYIFRRRFLFVFSAGYCGRCWWTVLSRSPLPPPPTPYFFFKQKISGNYFFLNQDSGSHEEVKCGTLKQASKKVKWLFTFWLWRIHWKQNEACWCENVGYITELIVNYSYKALRHTVLGPTGVNLCMVLYLTIREMCSYIIVLKM